MARCLDPSSPSSSRHCRAPWRDWVVVFLQHDRRCARREGDVVVIGRSCIRSVWISWQVLTAYSVASVSPIRIMPSGRSEFAPTRQYCKRCWVLRLGSGDPLQLCWLSKCPVVFHSASAWAAVPHDTQEHVRTSFFLVYIYIMLCMLHVPGWGPWYGPPHTHTQLVFALLVGVGVVVVEQEIPTTTTWG